jgi:opacity protein-like surface antigen
VANAQAFHFGHQFGVKFPIINGGIGWNDQSTHVSGSGDAGKALVDIIFDKLNSANSSQSQKQDANGIIGGAQVGYNWQFGRWVLGIEADLQSANVKGDASTEGVFPGSTVTFRYTGDQDLQWFGTMRGRLGWASEKILLFGTAGLAYGRTEASAKIADSNAAGATAFGGSPPITCEANVVCLAGASSQTTIGWAAGFGFELALSRAAHQPLHNGKHTERWLTDQVDRRLECGPTPTQVVRMSHSDRGPGMIGCVPTTGSASLS